LFVCDLLCALWELVLNQIPEEDAIWKADEYRRRHRIVPFAHDGDYGAMIIGTAAVGYAANSVVSSMLHWLC